MINLFKQCLFILCLTQIKDLYCQQNIEDNAQNSDLKIFKIFSSELNKKTSKLSSEGRVCKNFSEQCKNNNNLFFVNNEKNNSIIANEEKEEEGAVEQEPEVIGQTNNERGCDFGGRRLKIAASPQPPLVDCFQDIYGEWTCNGSNVEVIQLLSKQMNFQLEWLVLANTNLEKPKQRRPIWMDNNNDILAYGKNSHLAKEKQEEASDGDGGFYLNYSGVIGLVSSGRAFMAANGIINTVDRQKSGLLLSEPFDSFKVHLLLSKTVKDHDHIFIKPFSSTAWLGILLSSIFIALAFFIINSTSFHYVLLEDEFLANQVPIFKTLYYYVTRIIFKSSLFKRKRRRRARRFFFHFFTSNKKIDTIDDRRISSETSTSESIISFDRKVDKMISNNGMLNFDSKISIPFRRDERRRYKELCRRWLYERKRLRRLSRRKHKTGFFKLPYIIWYVVGSLANQGGETEDLPHASSTRILVAFWWLYLIVICSIHSGILTAILTFPKQLDFIQTLEDYLSLAESEKISLKLTVDKNSELANFLSNPNNLHKSPLQQLFISDSSMNSNLNHHHHHSDDKDYRAASYERPIIEVDFKRYRQRLLDDIQLGQAAYLEEKSTINLIITQEYFDQKPPKCQFKSSRYPIDIIPMSLILNKNELLSSSSKSNSSKQSCLALMNNLLTRIMRMGLAQKWRRKYEAQGNDCLNTVIINAGDVSKIEVRHVVLAFWLLAFGLLLGALSLVVEVVWLFTVDIDDDDDDDDDDFVEGKLNSQDNFYHYKRHFYRDRKNPSTQTDNKSSSSSGVFSSSSSSVSSNDDDDDDDDDSIESGLKLGHKVMTLKSRLPIRSLRDGGKNLSFKTALKKSNKGRKKLFKVQKVTPLPPSSLFLQQQQQPPTVLGLEGVDLNNDEDERGTYSPARDHFDSIQVDRQQFDLMSLGDGGELSEKTIVSLEEIDINNMGELSKAIRLEKRRKKAAKLNEKRSRRLKRTFGMVKRLHEGKIYSDSRLLLNKVQNRARRASRAIVGHFGGLGQNQTNNTTASYLNKINNNNNTGDHNKGAKRVNENNTGRTRIRWQ